MKKTIVFILSSNYSGSHFLSLLLGSHSNAAHLGELRNLTRKTKSYHVCGEGQICQFLKDIEKLESKDLYLTLFTRAGDTINILIDTCKKPDWAKQFIHLSDRDRYNIKIIHLVRDPRALMRRWINNYSSLFSQLKQKLKSIKRFPSYTIKLLFSSQELTYLYKWIYHNLEISRFITNNHLDYKIVTYQDLTTNTELIVSDLMRWLDVKYEKAQLNYW